MTGFVWLAALIETRGELRRQASRAATQARPAPSSKADQQEGGGGSDAAHVLGSGTAASSDEDDRAATVANLFRAAQHQYLRGDWAAAEQSVRQLLREDRNDVEAMLLRATINRTKGDTRTATRQMQHLARRADAAAWLPEIEAELKRLLENASPSTRDTTPPTTEPTTTESAVSIPHRRAA
ncbi:MAG: hypothetical protein AAF790_14940 [Planctomycetota bacterium]